MTCIENVSIILRVPVMTFGQLDTRRVKIATAMADICRALPSLNLLKPLNSRRSYVKYLHCTSAHTAAGLLRVYVNAPRHARGRRDEGSLSRELVTPSERYNEHMLQREST